MFISFRKVAEKSTSSATFRDFWQEKYDSGRKKIQNPNPDSRKRYPQIAASTAMEKYPEFREKVKKEFQQWKKAPTEKTEGKFFVKYDLSRMKINQEEKIQETLSKYPVFSKDSGLEDILDFCGMKHLYPLSKPEDISVHVFDFITGPTVKVMGSNFHVILEIDFEEDTKEPKGVYLNLLELDATKAGVGFQVFHSQVEEAKKKGFKKISCHAAGSADEVRSLGGGFVGFYVWPVFGFDAPLDEGVDPAERSREYLSDEEFEELEADWEDWKVKLKREKLPLTIQSLFKLKGGRRWWKENGWDLENSTFDLSDGSESMRILSAYKKAKEQKK